MDLKDFLLMIFDKQTDRYPIIRKSFLKSFDTNIILDILAITNYRCSLNELRRYVAYNYTDKGIKVHSMCNIPGLDWPNYSVDTTLDKYVNGPNTVNIIVGQFQQWINGIHNSRPPIISLFSISTSNSEFTFSMVISVHATGAFLADIGTMNIQSKVGLKIDNSVWINNITRLYPDEFIVVPMSDEDIMITEEEVTEFANIVTMSFDDVKRLFINEFNKDRLLPCTYEDILNNTH